MSSIEQRMAMLARLLDASGNPPGGAPTGAAGGDLGGTYPNPTVNATHSGSAHSALQPLDSDLTAIAALSTTAFGRGLLALADAAAGRTSFAAAPRTPDYLVGTADAELSAEIAVGTTPGGELGNTWASPTVDATHSGSSHAGAAAAAVTTHEGSPDPHPVYTTAAELAASTTTPSLSRIFLIMGG